MAENLTERQAKWFATIRAGLEKDTGKTLEEWVGIARACPETKHRARLSWFKANHGLLQNRASIVLDETFKDQMGWSESVSLVDNLWTDPLLARDLRSREVGGDRISGHNRDRAQGLHCVVAQGSIRCAETVEGRRRFAWLAIIEPTDPRLESAKGNGWSERLKFRAKLSRPADVDPGICDCLEMAWRGS